MTAAFRVVLALAALSATASAQVVRGPYLQSVTSDSVTVVWRSLLPGAGNVWYGPAPDQLTEKVAGSGSSNVQHEVRITGLDEGTRYYYAVGASAKEVGGSATYWFETAPTAAQPFRAWVVGDSGTGGFEQAWVRDAMMTFTKTSAWPDLFLHMGDMAYGEGTDLQFQFNFFGVYDAILRNTPCWPTLGNHEGKSSTSSSQEGPYYDAYVLPTQGEAGGVPSGTEAYYSFDYANVHFIVLDSHGSPRQPGGAMLEWLSTDLTAHDKDWVIAYWHHPPYTKGSHDSDLETQHIEMRENAIPILEAGGVDLVLGGHSHIYERSYLLDGAYDTPTSADGVVVDPSSGRVADGTPYSKMPGAHQGAVYVVAGHGGAKIKKKGNHPVMYFTETEHGSCLLDVNGPILTLKNLRHDGEISDSFTLVKGEAVLVTSPNGGEAIGGGQTVELTWKTFGEVPKVDVLLSLDNGGSWSTLAGDIANTGAWSWDVPGAATDEALIRVQKAGDPSLGDASDAPFTLSWKAPAGVIPYGATWRYRDELEAPGVDWTTVGYDDSGWASGAAPLGYGAGDEATALSDTSPNLPSYYFRHVVTLDEPSEAASLSVVHDDGVAVWINGQKVLEKDLAFGTEHLLYGGIKSEGDTATEVTLKEAGPLVAGENVVAVLVKQRNGTSSDVRFDLSMSVTPAAVSPPEPNEVEPTPPPAEPPPAVEEPPAQAEEPAAVAEEPAAVAEEPVQVADEPPAEPDPGPAATPDPGGTDPGTPPSTTTGDTDGGGCQSGGPVAGAPWWLLLALATLLVRRRLNRG